MVMMAAHLKCPLKSWKKIVSSAPGKLILFGEHSVVYEKTAVAVSIDKRTKVEVDLCKDGFIHVQIDHVQLDKQWSVESVDKICLNSIGDTGIQTEILQENVKALHAFLEISPSSELLPANLAAVVFIFLLKNIVDLNIYTEGIKISINSELVVAAGLGSSASFAVSLVTALLALSGVIETRIDEVGIHEIIMQKADSDIINKWAFLAEKICHGQPSGIDNITCTYGGAVSFKRKDYDQFDIGPELQVLMVNTKIPRNTKSVVAKVRGKWSKDPKLQGAIFDVMDAVAVKSVSLLRNIKESGGSRNDIYDELQEMIDTNQGLLYALGVSHPTLDEIVAIAGKWGFHAKLTGAGCGGFAYILIREGHDVHALIRELEDRGYDCFRVNVGGTGVRLTVTI